MKKMILLSMTLILLLACETGVKNQKKTKTLMSGIVDRTDSSSNSKYISSKTNKQSSYKTTTKKIFSKSAQPGYYLQMAVFKKYRPSKSFLAPLNKSSLNYIVLNKFNKDYVLIGPYMSHHIAKSKVASVKKILKKQTFVVQVLRP